jgi:hypothetical protein
MHCSSSFAHEHQSVPAGANLLLLLLRLPRRPCGGKRPLDPEEVVDIVDAVAALRCTMGVRAEHLAEIQAVHLILQDDLVARWALPVVALGSSREQPLKCKLTARPTSLPTSETACVPHRLHAPTVQMCMHARQTAEVSEGCGGCEIIKSARAGPPATSR